MNLANLLFRASRIWPDARAICRGEEIHATYGQFARRAAGIGGALSGDLGLRPGDRVYCMPCMSRLVVVEGEGGRLEARVTY